MSTFGVNLISTFGKPYSITYVAFSLADALLKRGVPISLSNVHLGAKEDQILRPDLVPHLVPANVEAMKHPINLLVLPASTAKSMMALLSQKSGGHTPGKFNVTNLWWELSKLSPQVERDLQRYDVVLTHSNFLANLASSVAPNTHVINSPLSWRVDPSISPDRKRFRLSESSTTYLFVFHADSENFTDDDKRGQGRKNPLTLIDTFLRAFPANQKDVQLVIRASHIEKPAHAELLSKLEDFARRDSRIRLIKGAMKFEDVMTLTASCDVYISLHKGEGFGLGMLEAMALGKPVVATAWSGNMSFMDATNACLVRYELESLREGYPYQGNLLPSGTQWAQPNLDDAAAYLRRLHQDKAYRSRIGRSARQAYVNYQAQAQSEKWIDELYMHWSMFDSLPRIPGKYSSV